jgi:hypothetical protein
LAVDALGSDEAKAVVAKMSDMPIYDFFANSGLLRADGRMVHDMYLVEVKKPEESRYPWDYYKILKTIPGEEAFRPGAALMSSFDAKLTWRDVHHRSVLEALTSPQFLRFCRLCLARACWSCRPGCALWPLRQDADRLSRDGLHLSRGQFSSVGHDGKRVTAELPISGHIDVTKSIAVEPKSFNLTGA